jgi:hypothetical protein
MFAQRLKPLALLAGLAALAGCNHFAHQDTVTSFAGEARAYNAAVHTIDPWPRESADARIAHDAERLRHAIERYRSGAAAHVPAGATPAPAGAQTTAPGL